MIIANYHVFVWKQGTLPLVWCYAGSKRGVLASFARAVPLAEGRKWRRVVAMRGGYLTGDVLAVWGDAY